MRIRSIKPEFWKSEKIASLPIESAHLFIGLWNLSDDAGRFRAHPSLIQGELFPYKPGAPIETWLQPLVAAGLVVLYEVEGRRYGHVVGFAEHQRIDKRTESRLPPPPARRRPARAAEQPADAADSPRQDAEPAELSAEPAQKSAEPAQKSADSAQRSVADWSREQGREGKGKEQAPERARVRARGASFAGQSPEPAPEPGKPRPGRGDDGASPIADLTTALLGTRYRAGIGNAIRRRGEVRDQAERLVATGLTADRVPELAQLAEAKSNGDPGALLAHWLDGETWREVLDEQAAKARQGGDLARGRAAVAAGADDVLDGIYGDTAKPAASVLDDVLAAARPVGASA